MLLVGSLIAIFALMLHVFCDGVQDSITFKRTHEGKHPYRDVWHVAKQFSRLSLIMLGVGFTIAAVFSTSGWILLLFVLLGLALFLKDTLWYVLVHDYAEKLYELDEATRWTTGYEWLDKLLGLDK